MIVIDVRKDRSTVIVEPRRTTDHIERCDQPEPVDVGDWIVVLKQIRMQLQIAMQNSPTWRLAVPPFEDGLGARRGKRDVVCQFEDKRKYSFLPRPLGLSRKESAP